MTVKEMYEQEIKPLPQSERLRLATMILGDMEISGPVDYRDSWSEEDLADLTRYSLKRASAGDGKGADDAATG